MISVTSAEPNRSTISNRSSSTGKRFESISRGMRFLLVPLPFVQVSISSGYNLYVNIKRRS